MFDREPVRNQASSLRNRSPSLIIQGITDKRRSLQQDLRAGLGKRKLTSEELKNRSLFLNRKEKKCFYGCQFFESLESELSFLTQGDIQIIADLLFEHKYVVPVMQFVTEMSNSTVYYRYPEDSFKIRESLKYEICDSRQFAKSLMQQTSHPHLTGHDIYRLLERYILEWSPELVVTPLPSKEANRKLRRVCQTMLIHGHLVPVETSNPERYQKFSFRYKYYFCDSDERMCMIREFQNSPDFDVATDSSSSHKKERNGFSLSRTFTATKEALTTRRKSDDIVLYWTVDGKSLDNPMQKGATIGSSCKDDLSKRIVAAPDVAVLKQSSVLLPSYTPPSASTDNFTLVFKRVCKKLASSSHYKIRDEKASIESISSIDAEWSVY